MKIVTWTALAFVLSSFSASAYIPDYKMIMSRVAENHGHGAYKIVQNLVFPAEPEPLVITESWIIRDENTMRVSLTGKGPLKGLVQGTIIYDRQKRIFLDGKGNRKSAQVGNDWVEPFFNFRFSKNIKPRMIALKMTPSQSLDPRKFNKENPFLYEPQAFMRLSRVGGVVAYAVGKPVPADGKELPPGLWVEQDRFHVLKIRMPSESVVQASDYARYNRKLWFPKERVYKWDIHSVDAQVNSVKALPYSKSTDALLSASSLNLKKNPDQPLKLPDQPMLVEFYQRFR